MLFFVALFSKLAVSAEQGYTFDNETKILTITDGIILNADIPEDQPSKFSKKFFGDEIKGVILKDGINLIGAGSFKEIETLETLEIPSSLQTFNGNPFFGCINLREVAIPGNTKFSFDNNIKNVKKVTIVGDSFTKPINAIFPGSINSIVDIVLPDTLTTLPDGAFSELTEVVTVTIPTSATNIGASSFEGCGKLETICYYGKHDFSDATIRPNVGAIKVIVAKGFYPPSPKTFGSITPDTANLLGTSFTWKWEVKIKTLSISLITGLSGIPTEIPDFVDAQSPFNDIKGDVQKVVISQGTTKIGHNCFNGFALLRQITIPTTLLEVGDNAFNGCGSLQEVELPSGFTKLGLAAFKGCKFLQTIVIPDTLIEYGDSCFEGCEKLTSFVIPNDTVAISSKQFSGCSILENVTLGSAILTIGASAFENCAKLTKIVIPEGAQSVGDMAFKGCTVLSSAEIPSTISTIGVSAFESCTSLVSVTIPERVAEPEPEVLAAGEEGEPKPIENPVTIKDKAFFGCITVQKVELSSTVNNIGLSAFEGCENIYSIVILGTATVADSSFNKCANILTVKIIGGVDKEIAKVFPASVEKINYVIFDEKVTKVSNTTFTGLQAVTQVDLPSSVTEIEVNAFADCTKLSVINYKGSTDFTEVNLGIPEGTKIYVTEAYTGSMFGGREMVILKHKSEVPLSAILGIVLGILIGVVVLIVLSVVLIKKFRKD